MDYPPMSNMFQTTNVQRSNLQSPAAFYLRIRDVLANFKAKKEGAFVGDGLDTVGWEVAFFEPPGERNGHELGLKRC